MKYPPTITAHAYDRARQRLGMEPAQFESWVRLTFRAWIAVNAERLNHHGVKASAYSRHYIAAWDVGEAAAFTLSNDGAIKTVLVYRDDFFDPPKATAKVEAAPPGRWKSNDDKRKAKGVSP